MDQEQLPTNPQQPLEEHTESATSQQAPEMEINYGRITYLSEEKGAFVELITGDEESTLRAASLQRSQKLEVFVPKELIAEKKNLARDLLVQLKRVGDTIVDIEPF